MSSELIEESRKFFSEIRSFTILLDQVFANDFSPGQENLKLNKAVYDCGAIECKHHVDNIFLNNDEYKHIYTIKSKEDASEITIEIIGNKTSLIVSVIHHVNKVYIELLHSKFS